MPKLPAHLDRHCQLLCVRPFSAVQLLVALDETEVTAWSHVHVAPELVKVLLAGCCDVHMDMPHHQLQIGLGLLCASHLELINELARHCKQ